MTNLLLFLSFPLVGNLSGKVAIFSCSFVPMHRHVDSHESGNPEVFLIRSLDSAFPKHRDGMTRIRNNVLFINAG